jgi:hypothetical protein
MHGEKKDKIPAKKAAANDMASANIYPPAIIGNKKISELSGTKNVSK